MNSAVERAITCIWEHYEEPLCLTDIAAAAILSRFHFSRIFKNETGVSPGRFLSAVRIYHAKRMLVTTSMKVTDISFAVGFNSLGSFTNHFTDSVGVSPARFRHISRNGGLEPPQAPATQTAVAGTVAGTINLPDGYAGAHAYVGVFTTPIVQCCPLSAALVTLTSAMPKVPYRLTNVPPGSWFVHAVAVADNANPEPWTQRALLTGGGLVVRVSEGTTAAATLSLRPRCPTDLPILLALPDLETELESLAPARAISRPSPSRTSASAAS